jgi:hypothetical protein
MFFRIKQVMQIRKFIHNNVCIEHDDIKMRKLKIVDSLGLKYSGLLWIFMSALVTCIKLIAMLLYVVALI